ncbi:Hypothetical protein NTJ_06533 [Nesidiocoris tenuis]|uniref:Uncharacterized protein n=1 Tax=Nesidiocoris tenuis TaxID=355587 RepID=A0ABN7AQJ8_9HEMI|nr:Hypothetical protein NTJ_06533 [Nesidiocoris tenuis]
MPSRGGEPCTSEKIRGANQVANYSAKLEKQSEKRENNGKKTEEGRKTEKEEPVLGRLLALSDLRNLPFGLPYLPVPPYI